jgi:hypothetical protein
MPAPRACTRLRPAGRKRLAVVATASAVHVDRWQWCQLIASEHGPASATTRHVLHVIALFMKNSAADAWPSQATIAKRSGLKLRAVKKHIAIAKRTFWLEVSDHHIAAGWRRNSYTAIVPARLFPLILSDGGGEEDGVYDHGAPGAPNRGTTYPSMVHQVPFNHSSNHLVNPSERRPARSVDKSRSTASKKSTPDDLKNRSSEKTSEKSRALRERVAAVTTLKPPPRKPISDSELAAKVRALRSVGHDDALIRRQLAGQADSAQLARALKRA